MTAADAARYLAVAFWPLLAVAVVTRVECRFRPPQRLTDWYLAHVPTSAEAIATVVVFSLLVMSLARDGWWTVAFWCAVALYFVTYWPRLWIAGIRQARELAEYRERLLVDADVTHRQIVMNHLRNTSAVVLAATPGAWAPLYQVRHACRYDLDRASFRVAAYALVLDGSIEMREQPSNPFRSVSVTEPGVRAAVRALGVHMWGAIYGTDHMRLTPQPTLSLVKESS